MWITNGPDPAWSMPKPFSAGSRGITTFTVETDRKGSSGAETRQDGHARLVDGERCSSEIPAENVLGQVGKA